MIRTEHINPLKSPSRISLKKENNEVAVKQRRRVFIRHADSLQEHETEYNYSSRDYTNFTELQISLPEVYEAKVIP